MTLPCYTNTSPAIACVRDFFQAAIKLLAPSQYTCDHPDGLSILLCLGEKQPILVTVRKTALRHLQRIHTGYPSGTPFIDYWWPFHSPLARRGTTDSRFTVRNTVLRRLAANIHTGYPSGTPFIDYWRSRVPPRASSLLEVLAEPLQVQALPMYSLSAILRLPSSASRTRDGNIDLGSSLDCLLPQPVTRLSAHPFPCVTLSVERRSI